MYSLIVDIVVIFCGGIIVQFLPPTIFYSFIHVFPTLHQVDLVTYINLFFTELAYLVILAITDADLLSLDLYDFPC